ncbi:hypothetical protein SASPL_153397 [Salvia splendens]|uniref:Transcription factor CBF/NF-Y/archaeal histone domain-containing protein n=1 Tax=Salvia splendens TaxID=180675 RepID=A0A8X8Z1R0_SALSN|nr:hypothetical protein SASPL_153397 [Salvia splendens]
MSDDNGGGGDHSPQSSVREQDRFLPIANIGRIMKKGLPANGKIAKDAKDTVQECVSEFISFVTSDALSCCGIDWLKVKAVLVKDMKLAFQTALQLSNDSNVSKLLFFVCTFWLMHSGFGCQAATIIWSNSPPSKLLVQIFAQRASDKCQKEKRKTINGDDLLWAMATLGFEDYITPLKVYLARYRELEGDTKGSARGADGAPKRETVGTQLGSDAQFAHQDSYAQGFGYSNSQIEY